MSTYQVSINSKQNFNVEINNKAIICNGNNFDFDITAIHDTTYHIIWESRSFTVELVSINYEKRFVTLKTDNGKVFSLILKNKLDLLLEKLGINQSSNKALKSLKAPMSGLIVSLDISEGDVVNKGDSLLILEAMKMENIIKSEGVGKVKKILVKAGDSVEKGSVLIEF